MSGTLTTSMATDPERHAAFSRYLWKVCYQLPIWGTLVAILVTAILVLIFSGYPFQTALGTAFGFGLIIGGFGLIFTVIFPPIFRCFYLTIVRRHSRDAAIALPYGFLLGMGLPLLVAAVFAAVLMMLRLEADMTWSTAPADGWHQVIGFIIFAGLASAIPGGIIGPIAAHFGLKALRPRDPFFEPPDRLDPADKGALPSSGSST